MSQFNLKYDYMGDNMMIHIIDETIGKLTLNVRGPSYLGLARSISWPLMPWLQDIGSHDIDYAE